MNRQKTIRSLLLVLEDFGRFMITKRFERPQPGVPTSSQMDVLLVIHFIGPLSLKGLAEKLRMTPSGASQLVNSLVNDGLLTRNEDGHDRRTVRLGLTEKAGHLLAEEKKMRMKQGRLLFAGLNDDELSQFEKIQRKILDGLHHQPAKKLR